MWKERESQVTAFSFVVLRKGKYIDIAPRLGLRFGSNRNQPLAGGLSLLVLGQLSIVVKPCIAGYSQDEA